MLGRNAAGIYWMFRYLERCENNARLLRAGLRISMPQYDHASQDWESVLMATSIKTLFDKIYNECNSSYVINFILREKENPSSVISSIDQARQNARMIRTVLTKEVFESINEIYFNLMRLLKRPVTEQSLPQNYRYNPTSKRSGQRMLARNNAQKRCLRFRQAWNFC